MTWTKNLLSYCDSGVAGNCPKCKSEKVNVEKHIHGKRTSLTFTCEECGSSDHFDGATIEDK